MISVFFLVFFVSFASSNPTMADTQNELSQSINHFSQDFYKVTSKLPENAGKNLIMSPLSAEIVLAMLSLGSQGETLKELNTALYLPNSDFTRAAFKPAIARLNSIKGVTLNVANKVFVKEGDKYVLAPAFKKDTIDVFSSEAENVDFAKNVAAAALINNWVEDKTNKRIKDLISADDLDDDTRLVLINAIYFKGSWKDKFDASLTKKKDFFITATDKKPVDMMHKTAKFNYAENSELDAKILELPYKDNEMSMVIILPNQVDGLAALEEKLSQKSTDLKSLVQNLYQAEVTVALPKFRIESTIDLNEVLPKLGMSRIFDGRAELGGLLANDEPLVVSKAIQKAFIEVNEEGAEAAAATAVLTLAMAYPGMKPHKKNFFTADHPFYFAVIESGGLTVFNGKLDLIE
nr:serpin [Limnephilus flavicornis]